MPLLKELRGFSKHRDYKHRAPDGACLSCAGGSLRSALTPPLFIRSV
jgi:hypothetical protein